MRLSAFLNILFLLFLISPSFAKQLYPFPENGKWGYIDAKGNMVLPARYESAGFFSDGLAKISVINERNEYLYGFINEAGKEIIPPKFVAVSDFIGGVARIKIKDKYALLLPDGTISTKADFDYIYPATNNVSIFQKNSKYGYIDNSGKIISEAIFDRAFNFFDGMALVGRKDRSKFYYGFMNTNGQIIVPLEYQGARSFSDGIGALFNGKNWYYIDKQGKSIFERSFNAIGSFYEGVARVQINNEWGYINKAGELIIPPIYKIADDFHKGFAIVGDGAYYGYINKENQQISPFIFTRATRFDGKLARVAKGNQNGFMNAQGRYNLTDKISSIGSFFSDRARMRVGRYYGYYDNNAKVAIKPKYLYTSDFKDELAVTVSAIPGGYETAYINLYGTVIKSWKILAETIPQPEQSLYTITYPNAPFYKESDPNSRMIIKANYGTPFIKKFQRTATPIIGHGLDGLLYAATYFGRPGFVFSEAVSVFSAPKINMGIYPYFKEKFGVVSETGSPTSFTRPMNSTFFNGSTLKRSIQKNIVTDTYFIPFMKLSEAFFIFVAAIGYPVSEYPERSMNLPNFLSKKQTARFSGRNDKNKNPLEFNIYFDKEKIWAKKMTFGVELIHQYPIPETYDTPKIIDTVFESVIKQQTIIESIQTNDMLVQTNTINTNTNIIILSNEDLKDTNNNNVPIIIESRSTNNIDITSEIIQQIQESQ